MSRFFRAIDLVLAILLFIVTLPALLVIMVITWCRLGCAPIFRDQRVGKDGRLFYMYKLVTMKPTPENLEMRKLGPIRKNDPRITHCSRFFRRYSLDELPQLINVIKGEMSLIGPRPELPHLTEYWSSRLPDYSKRLSALPGMSGMAQINGCRKSDIEPETRLKHDLYYINRRTFWLYFFILIMTPWAVVHYETW